MQIQYWLRLISTNSFPAFEWIFRRESLGTSWLGLSLNWKIPSPQELFNKNSSSSSMICGLVLGYSGASWFRDHLGNSFESHNLLLEANRLSFSRLAHWHSPTFCIQRLKIEMWELQSRRLLLISFSTPYASLSTPNCLISHHKAELNSSHCTRNKREELTTRKRSQNREHIKIGWELADTFVINISSYGESIGWAFNSKRDLWIAQNGLLWNIDELVQKKNPRRLKFNSKSVAILFLFCCVSTDRRTREVFKYRFFFLS